MSCHVCVLLTKACRQWFDLNAFPSGLNGALVDNAAMSTILVELDRVAGCAERTPVLDTTSRLADDFILSGTDVGGRRLWRLSLNASNAWRQQGGALAVGVNLGAPLPGGATRATCTLRFDGGRHLPTSGEARTATAQGLWVAQPLGSKVHVHCPELAEQSMEWPLSNLGSGMST